MPIYSVYCWLNHEINKFPQWARRTWFWSNIGLLQSCLQRLSLVKPVPLLTLCSHQLGSSAASRQKEEVVHAAQTFDRYKQRPWEYFDSEGTETEIYIIGHDCRYLVLVFPCLSQNMLSGMEAVRCGRATGGTIKEASHPRRHARLALYRFVLAELTSLCSAI